MGEILMLAMLVFATLGVSSEVKRVAEAVEKLAESIRDKQ